MEGIVDPYYQCLHTNWLQYRVYSLKEMAANFCCHLLHSIKVHYYWWTCKSCCPWA